MLTQGPYGPPGMKGEIGMPGRPVSPPFMKLNIETLLLAFWNLTEGTSVVEV